VNSAISADSAEGQYFHAATNVRALCGEMKVTACKSHTKKQSTERSVRTAAYVITSVDDMISRKWQCYYACSACSCHVKSISISGAQW